MTHPMEDTELYERLCNELKFRVRNAAAHAYSMSKHHGRPDLLYTQEQIIFGADCILNILEQELEEERYAEEAGD